MATTRAAGRPRGFDEADVLDRALEVFWTNGYRTTTTRDLEAELGISQSSLYNTFGSKHALLLRALDVYEQRVSDEVVRPLEGSTDGLDALAAFFHDLAAWVTHDGRRGCMIINLTAESGVDDPTITRRTEAYRRRVRDALRGALARAARHGEIAAEELDDRATLLYGVVLGLNIAARGGADAAEIDALRASAVTAVESWRV